MVNVFIHGGRLGDAVMALYAAKKVGGGIFQMCLRHEPPWDHKKLNSILALVKYQSYIKDAIHVKVPKEYIKPNHIDSKYIESGADPIPWTHSFIESESKCNPEDYPEYKSQGKNWLHYTHQARRHCDHFGVKWEPDIVWLEAPKTKGNVDVLFHAPSYRLVRSRQSWIKIIELLSSKCNVVVITGPDDRHEWSDVAKVIVPEDFLEVADYINSAKCFLGAASSCYCVAEGLRKLRFVELRADCYNTHCYGETGHIINNWSDDIVIESVLGAVI